MGRAKDRQGNIWETDANGNAVRMIQPAQPASMQGGIPGSMAVVPPSPLVLAQKQREQARQDAADRRAQAAAALSANADRRAAAAEARAQAKFESEDTMAPPPGNANLSGEDYLKTISPSLAGQVRALAEGRRAFPTGSALRSPAVQQLIAAATQYDPTLDAANSVTRVATRKKFTSGTTRDNITAINTALGHLGSLWSDAQKLNNFGSPLVNAPINALEQHVMGDARYSNFDLTRHAVVDELEKAFRGSGGTQAGIDEWKNGINSAQSPDQLRGAIGKAVELLDSRLQALGDAYTQGMGHSADPMTFLNPHAQAVFSALGPGGDGNVPPLPKDFGGAPPILGNGGAPPPAPPAGGPPVLRPADYSGMANDAQRSVAGVDPNKGVLGQTYKREYDPVGAAAIATFIRHGAPYETVTAYAQSHGYEAPPEGDYLKAVEYQKANPKSQPNVESNKLVPTTIGERLAASPAAAAVVGANAGATAGLSDTVGRTIAGPEWDANRQAMALTNPTADFLGNTAGGVGAAVGGNALLSRFAPGALALGSKVFGKFAPMAADAAYGATYGANENPDNPLEGAGLGALIGAGGGALGRKVTNGLANVISPPAGDFASAYANGSFPTLGQRFGQSGFAGRAINTAEQALQSFPGLGAMVARARELPRQAQKVGMMNDALSHIEPHQPGSMLPPNVTKMGTAAQSHAAQAFDSAYATARSGMNFAPDKTYLDDVAQLGQRVNSAEFTPDQSAQLNKAVDDAVVSRLKASGGVLNGSDYVRAGSELGRIRNAWAKNPATSHMADVLGDYLTTMDSAAIRSSDPAAGQMLQDTNAGYAKLVRLQKAGARAGGDAGDFTPKAFASVVQKEGGGVRDNAFNQGRALMQPNAKTLSLMGDTLPNSGSAERLMTGQAVTGGVGSMVGAPSALLAHPGALAPFAMYAPGGNALMTRLIAPRSAVLPPEAAAILDQLAAGIKDRSALGGRLTVPGALALEFNQ